MTCADCSGQGRFYKQICAGVWKIAPCLCKASENIRDLRKLRRDIDHQINQIRIREARERLGITNNQARAVEAGC